MSEAKNRIPVLERAVEVMEYIAGHPGRVSQPELIAALKIPQATCYRIIATLVAANWLVRLPGNRYDVAPGIARLSRKTELQLEKYRSLQPALDYLARQVGYSVKLSVADGDEHVNVLSAKAPWDLALTAAPGTRFEIKSGGSVAVILLSDMAEDKSKKIIASADEPEQMKEMLNAFRRQGYSFYPASGSSEQQSKIDALSLPVFSPEKNITAVVTLLSMPGELAKADLGTLLEEMRKTARFCGDMMV